MTEAEFLKRFDAHIARMDAHIVRMDARLERLDAHMERGDAHMERGNKIMARSNEIMARSNEIMARSNELIGDHRLFVREIAQRIAVAGRRQDAINDHMIGRMDALTKAVLRVVDRLDGGAQPAT